jgi:phosphatidylglycerol---prolipoprotein diacylglyceryl transferase
MGLYRISRQRSGMWVDAALIVLLGSLVGARAGYVFIYSPYFTKHPGEILQIWRGGLSGVGAIAGASLCLILTAAAHRAPILRMADWLYPLIPPIGIGVWLGCWLSGIAYGQALPPGTWWGIPAIDESGLIAARVPLQLAAALSLAIFFFLLETLILLPRPSGWLSSLAIAWLTLVALVVSLLRVDPSPQWHGLRIDTWGYIVLTVIFYALFTWRNFLARKPKKTV